MRIEFRQTGGFVGGNWRAVIDTTELSLTEAQTLMRLVEDADFFALPSGLWRFSRLSTVDHFSYTITITDGKRKRWVRRDDLDMPAALWPLVEYLSQRAQIDR